MPRKGENIYKRRDDRWEARYIKGYKPDGSARYGYCYAKSYREVREKLNAKKAAESYQAGAVQPAAAKRFGVYCEEWLSLSRSRVKESTYVKYETVIQNHILPELGGFRLGALSSILIEQFSRKLFAEELSPRTIRLILIVVHSVIGYIRRQNPSYLPQNIEIVYPKDVKKETRVLTREEQQTLTSYLLSSIDECKFGVLLALITGLRIGEICALRWRDISLADKTLTVAFTMMRLKDTAENAPQKTKVVLVEPKSGASQRTIPLTDLAVDLCLTRKNRIPDAFVLTGDSERFIEPRTLQNRLHTYTSECGIEGVHFHTLRHTFATRCVEVGFEIKSLSEILGHTGPRFTLERYVHSSMELKRDNMRKLTAIGC